MKAVFAAAAQNGPGVGLVTVESHGKKTVVFRGTFGGGINGRYGTASGYGGGNFVGVGPTGFGGLGSGFGGIAGPFPYGIGGQGFGGVGNNSEGITVGGGPLKKF